MAPRDADSLAREAADRVREVIAEAEARAREIVAEAEAEAERVRSRAEAEARDRVDRARRALEQLEDALGGSGESPAAMPSAEAEAAPPAVEPADRAGTAAEESPAAGESSAAEEFPAPDEFPPAEESPAEPAARRVTTDELIEQLKGGRTSAGEARDEPSAEPATEPTAGSTPESATQPTAGSTSEAAAEAAAGPTAEPADRSTGGQESEGDVAAARLVAMNMALEGASREEIQRRVDESFEIGDAAAIVDSVLARVNRS